MRRCAAGATRDCSKRGQGQRRKEYTQGTREYRHLVLTHASQGSRVPQGSAGLGCSLGRVYRKHAQQSGEWSGGPPPPPGPGGYAQMPSCWNTAVFSLSHMVCWEGVKVQGGEGGAHSRGAATLATAPSVGPPAPGLARRHNLAQHGTAQHTHLSVAQQHLRVGLVEDLRGRRYTSTRHEW